LGTVSPTRDYVSARIVHGSRVLGLGALLDDATYQTGNSVMILVSLLSMILVVIVLNRLVWRRFYNLATERYRLDY
jgi:NitT/TauT family transport system permease protein